MAYRSDLETRLAKKTTKAIVDYQLIEDGDRTATVRASGDVEALKLDKAIFRAVVQVNPEIKEHFGGYSLVECADLDEALKWAATLPAAREGKVEVRPVVQVVAPAERPAG